ncbi:MAG: RHS repeat domain-containing protein, partial [Flavobacteriales bacterium]
MHIIGEKQYELSNHLGNVLATVSDKKYPIETDNDAKTDHYEAELISSQDYSAFGALQPGREYSTREYRYGFQGQEKDDEVKGKGNSYSTKFRQYDPRAGRWFSVDFKRKPNESPYAVYSNNPIWFIDPLGLDTVEVFNEGEKEGEIKEHIETEEGKDVFFLVDEEGNREKSISFEEGTLQDVR